MRLSKVFCTLLLILCTGLQAGAQEEGVILAVEGDTVRGSLRLPRQLTKKSPVVLIIAGSGATDRNGNQAAYINNAYRMLADSLAAAGIASVRYDKRGVGESAGAVAEIDLRFEDYVGDAKGWIAQLAADKRFSKVIVAGHSEGSLIGMVASANNPSVAGYISIAGPARPAGEMIKEQLLVQPEAVRALVYPRLDTLEQGDTLRGVPPVLYTLFRPSVQPYLISWFRYDPRQAIAALRIPVYVVQGETDIQVPAADAGLLAAANPKASRRIISGMNHVLKNVPTLDRQLQIPSYSAGTLPLHKELAPALVSFIKSVK